MWSWDICRNDHLADLESSAMDILFHLDYLIILYGYLLRFAGMRGHAAIRFPDDPELDNTLCPTVE